jgi:DNA-binding transcriptional regulator YiaG
MRSPPHVPPANESQLIDLASVRHMAKSGRAREIRERAGLSLHDVARVVGVAPATLQRWEVGARRPYSAAALRYGALLNQLAELASDPSEGGDQAA